MAKDFQFILEKGSKKHLCPGCGKKSYVRFFDTLNAEYLPHQYGRCDHENHCGYYLNPYKAGYATNLTEEKQYKPQPKQPPKPVYFLPETILNKTLKNYDKNIFVQNLLKFIPVEEMEKIISLYRIGTIGQGSRAGAVTFPFIDASCNIRTIQAKQFDNANHTTSTDFVHSIAYRHYEETHTNLPVWLQDYLTNEKFVSCLFGEHLLAKYPANPIALVEAPKTAIIGTLYYGLPASTSDLLWLAVYNKSSLTYDKCKSLKGRKVVLYPDLNAYDEWNKKSLELCAKLPGTRFVTSDILEKYASVTERYNALDLADYLIKFDYRQFRGQMAKPEPVIPPCPTPPFDHKPLPAPIPAQKIMDEKSENCENVKQSYFSGLNHASNALFDNPHPSWSVEIQSLESFFSSTTLPQSPVQLSQGITITDLIKFISGHLAILHAYNGNPVFLPYLHRLQLLHKIITLDHE